MKCPHCGLLNPPGARRCDCGWDFLAPRPAGAGPEAASRTLAFLAQCKSCGSRILFGGYRVGSRVYCRPECIASDAQREAVRTIDGNLVMRQALEIRRGPCPECRGPGPVDLHTSYRVWSALLFTQWTSHPVISCHGCGVKAKLLGVAFSGLLGWWGFPWGLLVTPFQIARNVVGLLKRSGEGPSPDLLEIIREELGAQVATRGRGLPSLGSR